ncbi:class I SAM-dependent methyltransferase [Lentzea sp. NPDC058436]|uniref:class I SAM-dependent methyltransferase n=1 Tax=Lentzea sp. NPDC058436 TaxID=3346499 RepID=UPI0036532AA2
MTIGFEWARDERDGEPPPGAHDHTSAPSSALRYRGTPLAPFRLAALQSAYDEPTVDFLRAVGVGEGARCWEVGAGTGAVAGWLSERVGSGGHVLATDDDPRQLERLTAAANVAVRRHDLLVDEMPAEQFDLVHARLQLTHRPDRVRLVTRLLSALVPGGCLVVEEVSPKDQRVLSADRASAFYGVQWRVLELLSDAGCDFGFADAAGDVMKEAGLVDVGAVSATACWHGGDVALQVLRASVLELGPWLAAAGVEAQELDDYLELLDDPSFELTSYPLISTCGRKPLTPAGW